MSLEPPRDDFVYLAAAIDCEGSIGAYWTGSSFMLRVRISNTNPVLVEWLYATFGGTIGILDRSKKGWKNYHYWSATNDLAITLIEKVLPLLKLKLEQARAVLAMGAIKRIMANDSSKLETGQAALNNMKNRLTLLNKRGVA